MGGDDKIECHNDATIGDSQTFHIEPIGNPEDGWVGLKAQRNGKYCADEPDGIKCNRHEIGGWERFKIERNDDGTHSIMGNRENRWCMDDWYVKCKSGNRNGDWEKFQITFIGVVQPCESGVEMMTLAFPGHHNMVCQESQHNGIVECNKDEHSKDMNFKFWAEAPGSGWWHRILGESVGGIFSKWTLLIGPTLFDDGSSIPDPTLSLSYHTS